MWQVERRAWKLDLIATVDARVHAPAVPAPGPPDWAELSDADDAYRHVLAEGTWLRERDTLVQAVTELGSGYWVLAPLRTGAGWTVLVNRGFVPMGRTDPATVAASEPAGPVHVAGLLRPAEPGGGFLRRNDPAGNRWFSRDVAAIAAARGLAGVAPYFIDAEAGPDPAALPVGGLTVVAFRNAHLLYALTWFGLAALSAAGLVVVLRSAPAAA